MCGGTRSAVSRHMTMPGLSPRVRGNRWRRSPRRARPRSIPACAGEPAQSICTGFVDPVYPRVCGGTGCPVDECLRGEGLSPRVRGNLYGKRAAPHIRRSIPACAGEPRRPGRPGRMRSVYPRVCGGTRTVGVDVQKNEGLSPRVRGNRLTLAPDLPTWGSIPACAGEPPSWSAGCNAWRVYPRVCGGTESQISA